MSFGLAGALVPELPEGTVLTATRVVAEDGSVLWEGDALPVRGATPAVLCGAARVVDEPAERPSWRAERARLLSIWRAVRWLPAAACERSGLCPTRPPVRSGACRGPRDPDGSVAWGTVVRARRHRAAPGCASVEGGARQVLSPRSSGAAASIAAAGAA